MAEGEEMSPPLGQGRLPQESVSFLGFLVPLWSAIVLRAVVVAIVLIGLQQLLKNAHWKIARKLLRRANKMMDDSACANIRKQERELICYAILVTVGWCSLPWHRYIFDPATLWTDLTISGKTGFYYSLQIGTYLQFVIFDFVDRCEKTGPEPMDVASWVHHVLCFVLALGSLIPGYVQAGSVTFLLHDPSSFVLKLARIYYLSGWKQSASISFKIFAGSFLLLRLIVYPILFYLSATKYAVDVLPPPILAGFSVFLSILILINAFFMYKIVSVIIRESRKTPALETQEITTSISGTKLPKGLPKGTQA